MALSPLSYYYGEQETNQCQPSTVYSLCGENTLVAV